MVTGHKKDLFLDDILEGMWGWWGEALSIYTKAKAV